MRKILYVAVLIFVFGQVCDAAEKNYAKVKDTLEVEPGLFLTLNSIRLTKSGNPDKGAYIIFDCTYENKSGKRVTVSSIMSLDIQDADGYKHNLALWVGAETKGSLDGRIENGDKLRGEVAFDVEVGTVIEFFCYSPFWSGSVSQWRVNSRVNP